MTTSPHEFTSSPPALATTDCVGPFECYLADLVLVIPDFSIIVNDTIEVTVKGLTCQDITLTETVFAYLPPYALEQEIGGLGLHCAGDFEWKDIEHPLLLNGKGNISLTAEEGSVDLIYDILPSSDISNVTVEVPGAAECTSCKARLRVSELEFGGEDPLDELLEFLSPALRLFLDVALPYEVCKALKVAIDEDLSGLLQNFDEAISPLLVL